MRKMRSLSKFYLLAGVWMIAITTQAQIDTINLKRLSLKGKVKKIDDFSYFLEANSKGNRTIDGKRFNALPLVEDWNVGKDKVKDAKTNVSYEFDKLGKNTNVVTYYSEGQPFGEAKFVYDLGGRIIKSQAIFKVSDGDYAIEKQYVYDDKKRLVQINETDGVHPLQTITFEYDKVGNCIEKSKVKSLFILKEEGYNLGENMTLNEQNRTEYTKKEYYKYNTSNRITFSEESFPQHNVFLRVENEYDKKNRLSKTKFLNEESKETVCSYVYDNKGRLVQKICTAKDDNDFYLKTEVLYGATGKTEIIRTKTDIISKKVFDANGLLQLHRTPEFDYQYKYSFDKKGNWKESVLYENGTPTKVRVRKIEYY